MDYERIDKIQAGIISPRLSPNKLRRKLIGVQRGRKVSELDSALSSSKEGPDTVGLVECARDSLLSSGSGNVDDEGFSGMQDFSNRKENGHAVHEAGHTLQTNFPAKSSATTSACEEVPDLGSAAQNLASMKDFQFKENHNVQLKVQNITKPTNAQVEYTGNLNVVHAMRSFEDDNFEYDSGHENGSVSSFEFHKGDRPIHRRVLGPHSKPAPSKWDDAEKWLVNHSSGDSHMKPKPKSGSGQIQGVTAGLGRKVNFPGQGVRPMGGTNIHMAKSASNALGGTDPTTIDGRSLNQEEGETKKVYPDKPVSKMDDGGTAKFAFMPPAASHLITRTNDLDRYSLEDVSCCAPGEPKGDGEALLKPSLRIEKPIADPAVEFSKNGHSFTQHVPPSYAPPPSTVRSVAMRDMGTEMTPIASQEPSRTGTPVRATSPTARSPMSSRPSTPGRAAPASSPRDGTDNELDCQGKVNIHELSEKELHERTRQEIIALGEKLGKANIAAWASKREEEENDSRSQRNRSAEPSMSSALEARAAAWEEAEKAKYMARYRREEVKIEAWENHQKTKAEAEMRRIEVKAERMRSHAHEKLMNKLAGARHRAEEKRAAAEAKRSHEAAKTAQQAEYIRQTGRIPSPFFHWSCCS